MANLYAFIITHFQFSMSMTLSFPQCIAFLAKLIILIGDYFRCLKGDRVQGRDDCDELSHIRHKFLSAKSQHSECLGNSGHHFKTTEQTPSDSFTADNGELCHHGLKCLLFNASQVYLNVGLIIKNLH